MLPRSGVKRCPKPKQHFDAGVNPTPLRIQGRAPLRETSANDRFKPSQLTTDVQAASLFINENTNVKDYTSDRDPSAEDATTLDKKDAAALDKEEDAADAAGTASEAEVNSKVTK
ncbi:hypothetical protein K469DRAFT_683765 [Zopfia rhizophila CBS 207.26]|uniref:Uncharacterized protein n=1 Tax=Zopfia rhizophila CBS 207.26 TaxID=1314779 RepID=A0A6A6EDR8_9PEZI|nr:hypothetical protein K469DRAFT_683765 [Zopfia rhizophila CBS 207.26]